MLHTFWRILANEHRQLPKLILIVLKRAPLFQKQLYKCLIEQKFGLPQCIELTFQTKSILVYQ